MTVLATLLTGTGTALVAPSAAGAAAGAALKLTATDDGYTSSGRRSANFGQEDKLAIGRLDGDTKVSFLKFVVPAGAAVTGARLDLSSLGEIAGSVTISRVLDTTWSEKTLTSGNAPALGMAVAAGKANGSTVSFNLGGEIAGPGTYSFAVQSSAASAVTRFRSAENAAGGPVLTVATSAAAAPAPVSTDTDTSPPVSGPVTKPAATTPAAGPTVPTTAPSTPATVPTTAPSAPAATPTKAPVTGPTAAPTAPAPIATAPTAAGPTSTTCTTGALLVPSCGVLWGAAAGGFTDAPRDQALVEWEALSGRTASIFHTYHKGDEPFPTKSEIAMTTDPAHPRVLLLNWKIAYGSTWAKVAAGQQDKRIDAFAARIKATYPGKFFLVLNHEPENDVVTTAGSGMQAKDFAAMYRYTILRLRAKGVTNAINVLAYMGNERWMAQSWWKDLYPGDDVVDWMGLDSYVSAAAGYHYGMFADLLDRQAPNGPTFYNWAVVNHGSKPMMVAEWGAYNPVGKAADKTPQFNSVLPELAKRPQIKAIVYFDTAHDDQGDRDISINNTAGNLASFKKLAANPLFNVKITG